MGTDFDFFGPEAKTRYFEECVFDKGIHNSDGPMRNRRILYHVLIGQGFTNYDKGWWHFEYGNQFWGRTTGQPALDAGIEHPSEVVS